jgi:hypothetical protein
VALARDVHERNGHFHRDMIKVQLLDRICSPALDQSIVKAITECGRCKNFGARHVHSLLEPITRRHPFELMTGNTLSMPCGKGGYHKLSLNMDVFAQRLWVRPLTTAASGDTTVKTLGDVWGNFPRPETYMCDGGPEFDNWKLRKLCEESGVELHIVPKYSPWVNGLLEGMNSKLLGRLKRLCAPGLGENDYDKMQWEDLPENCPSTLWPPFSLSITASFLC